MAGKKALVVDVGHVICDGSIMNFLIARLSSLKKDVVLYDNELLMGLSNEVIDEWVSAVCKIKVGSIVGISLFGLREALCEMPLTEGFAELVKRAQGEGIEVILIGAVPRQITQKLVACHDVEVDCIFGSELIVTSDRILGVEKIMTPSLKRQVIETKVCERTIDRGNSVIVGDSIGDLQMMGIVPRQHRVGFNATSTDVLEFVGAAFAGSMRPVAGYLEKIGFLNTKGK